MANAATPLTAASDASIPARFRDSVRRHADRLAVRAQGRELSYAELETEANGIARAILDARGSREEPIAVLMDKTVRLVATFLGVLAAGKAVVPLNPSYPAPLLARICATSGATMLVTDTAQRPLASALDLADVTLFDVDTEGPRPTPVAPAVEVLPTTLATILYTSGSTGEPKGVAQDHRGTLHNAVNLIAQPRITGEDRLALVMAAGTVGTMRDMLAALLTGASIHLFDLRAGGVPALADWLREERVTYLNLVVTLFRHLVAAVPPGATFPAIRVMRSGSEPLTPTDLEAFRRHFPPHCVLFGGFSTTETGTATRLLIRADAPVTDDRLSAGYPADDVEVLVLDEAGCPVAPGVVGEIAIRSRYLALGYWRRPELTARVFRPDPDGGDARIYLTGDLGRVRADGCLEVVGRRDARVKIHGANVDPTDVELNLYELPGVRQVAVVLRERTPGDPRLVAYVAVGDGPAPTAAAMRRHLRARLPDHMIPAAFVTLPALPPSLSGKVDRRALPEPDWSRSVPFVAPRSPLEQLLADMWGEILQTSPVGVDDGFVELGGDSLLALGLVAAIRDRLQLDVAPAVLLEAGTVAEMAVAVIVAGLEGMPAGDRERFLHDADDPDRP